MQDSSIERCFAHARLEAKQGGQVFNGGVRVLLCGVEAGSIMEQEDAFFSELRGGMRGDAVEPGGEEIVGKFETARAHFDQRKSVAQECEVDHLVARRWQSLGEGESLLDPVARRFEIAPRGAV